MLLRSHSERRPLLGFSALLTQQRPLGSTVPPPLSAKESVLTLQSLTPPPPWVTQAVSRIDRGERELQRLRERQQAEADEVNRELDSAVIDAQKEERRLLEEVERDHRETLQLLSQVRRENAAAVRVVQSLVDRQLQKMGRLKEQIQRWDSSTGGSEKLHQLQRGVEEVTKPWEICLTLKRVSFLPNSTSETSNISNQVAVHEQGMTYPIGVCGVQGQKCALHAGESTFSNITPVEIRKEPQESIKTKSVQKKLHLLNPPENEDQFVSPTSLTPRHRGVSESSQEEEPASVCSDAHSQDLFLSIPVISSQGESEDDALEGRRCVTKKRFMLKGKKKQKSQILVSCEEQFCPPEKCEDSPCRPGPGSLSTRGHSLRNTSNESSKDVGSPASPGNRDDPSDMYPENVDGSIKQKNPSRSTVHADKGDCGAIRKVNRMLLASEPSPLEQGRGLGSDGNATSVDERHSRSHSSVSHDFGFNFGSKSVSMSAIGGTEWEQGNTGRESRDEGGGSSALDSAYLVKQFGKQGSGRTDFNLPSGLHATVTGQLFVVDCGNARIQVTDGQKNVVQQVSTSGTERSSRICNYFDVAVNSKGLIALTCAAERAVLVFSRHGRLLQTFGGVASGATNEELDAPRGVTLTRQDEFLIADIKRGTLTALKLDPKSGARLERTVVTGYHRPYMVAACLVTGLIAVSERGSESGRVPCIRVLEPGWTTIRILGVCSGLGPVLSCPWGLCIDSDGDVLVVDWGKQRHQVLLYPSKGAGWPLVTDHLNSPRGLALLPDGHMAMSDSMNHSIKIYRYK